MLDSIFNKEIITKSYKEMETLKLNFLLKQTHNNRNNHLSKNTCLKLMLSSKPEELKLLNYDNFISLYFIFDFFYQKYFL